MKIENVSSVPASFKDATGPISVTLRNDMMFHRVMQNSNRALKGLVCALKGLDPKNVKNVELTNPIDYASFNGKEIILDIKVLLNNNSILDIELQLYRCKYWEHRSLLYLCRSFDSIGISEDYYLLKPTSLIAIMDDPLFPEYPEFYSKYQFLNIRNYQPYSTMLSLNVLYLNCTDLATDEDKANNLVYWAKLFQATTWDELKKLSTLNPDFEEVAAIMYKSNIQSQERTLFEAHQKYVMDRLSTLKEIEESTAEARAKGWAEGRAEGRAEGLAEGHSEGYSEAKAEDQAQINALSAEVERLTKLLSESGVSVV